MSPWGQDWTKVAQPHALGLADLLAAAVVRDSGLGGARCSRVDPEAFALGPRCAILAAGLRDRLAEVDLSKVDGEPLKFMPENDAVAEMAKILTTLEQKSLFNDLLKTFTTAKHMEQEVAAFLFFRCKKPSEDKED